MLISVIMGGSLIAMFAAGWVVNVKGKRAALVWGNVLVGLFCLAVLVTDSFLGALLALFFAGVGAAFQTPVGSKTVMTWFPIEQRGMSMGVRQTGIPLGRALLPFNALHRRLAHRGRERWPGLLRECGAVSVRLPKNRFYVRTRHDVDLFRCAGVPGLFVCCACA